MNQSAEIIQRPQNGVLILMNGRYEPYIRNPAKELPCIKLEGLESFECVSILTSQLLLTFNSEQTRNEAKRLTGWAPSAFSGLSLHMRTITVQYEREPARRIILCTVNDRPVYYFDWKVRFTTPE